MLIERLEYDRMPGIPLNDLQKAMKEQIERKTDRGIYRFEKTVCPVCLHSKNQRIGAKDRYGLYFPTCICLDCGMVYTNPRMDQASYGEFYNQEYRKLYTGTETATETFFSRQQQKGQRIHKFLQKHGIMGEAPRQILEIGCGAGGILDYFSQHGHQVLGIDPGEEYINYGREKRGLNLRVGTLKTTEINCKPDLVIYSHVLEHVLDVNAEIEFLKNIMCENTVLYIEVPGIKQIHKNYRMDLLRYFQNAHTFHFTLESLNNLMGLHGIQAVAGNQFVQSAFRFTDYKTSPQSDYKIVIDYILWLEKNRKLYIFTPPGLMKNFENIAIGILDLTNTRKLARRLKQTLSHKF